jgi:hypothetical protein
MKRPYLTPKVLAGLRLLAGEQAEYLASLALHPADYELRAAAVSYLERWIVRQEERRAKRKESSVANDAP